MPWLRMMVQSLRYHERAASVAVLQEILLSEQKHYPRELQKAAAESLAVLVGEPFDQVADPVQAAHEWLLARTP